MIIIAITLIVALLAVLALVLGFAAALYLEGEVFGRPATRSQVTHHFDVPREKIL